MHEFDQLILTVADLLSLHEYLIKKGHAELAQNYADYLKRKVEKKQNDIRDGMTGSQLKKIIDLICADSGEELQKLILADIEKNNGIYIEQLLQELTLQAVSEEIEKNIKNNQTKYNALEMQTAAAANDHELSDLYLSLLRQIDEVIEELNQFIPFIETNSNLTQNDLIDQHKNTFFVLYNRLLNLDHSVSTQIIRIQHLSERLLSLSTNPREMMPASLINAYDLASKCLAYLIKKSVDQEKFYYQSLTIATLNRALNLSEGLKATFNDQYSFEIKLASFHTRLIEAAIDKINDQPQFDFALSHLQQAIFLLENKNINTIPTAILTRIMSTFNNMNAFFQVEAQSLSCEIRILMNKKLVALINRCNFFNSPQSLIFKEVTKSFYLHLYVLQLQLGEKKLALLSAQSISNDLYQSYQQILYFYQEAQAYYHQYVCNDPLLSQWIDAFPTYDKFAKKYNSEARSRETSETEIKKLNSAFINFSTLNRHITKMLMLLGEKQDTNEASVKFYETALTHFRMIDRAFKLLSKYLDSSSVKEFEAAKFAKHQVKEKLANTRKLFSENGSSALFANTSNARAAEPKSDNNNHMELR